MRIGVPTTSYPRFDGDPSGSFVRALCVALTDRGHTCDVLAPDDPASAPLDDRDISVRRLLARAPRAPATFYGAGAPDNVRRDPRALAGAFVFAPHLLDEVRRNAARWDAVLSHWAIPSALLASLGARAARARPRHVAVWHSADVQLAHGVLGARAWRLARRLADEHVFVAAHLRQRLGAAEDPHAHVVPMGVTIPPASHGGRREGPVRALVLARLVPIKRVELAIAACASAAVPLVVAGDGPERGRLEALATALGGEVRFVGAVDEARKRALFAQSDVLLATSAHDPRGATEGYPVAPREALAHGLVVLATRDPVHEELRVRCGAPVVIAPDDGLASSLASLQHGGRLETLSASARESVASDAWPVVAERIEGLLSVSQSSTRRAPGWGESESAAVSMRAG